MKLIAPRNLPTRQQPHRTTPMQSHHMSPVTSRPCTASYGLKHSMSLPYSSLPNSRYRFHSNATDTPSLTPNNGEAPFTPSEKHRAFGRAVVNAQSVGEIGKLLSEEMRKDNLLKMREADQKVSHPSTTTVINNIKPNM